MKLNTYSFVHTKIRYLCHVIEKQSGVPLQTDLSNNFDSIFFKSDLQYIRIDYKRYAYYVLNVRLTGTIKQAIEDALVYLSWLNTTSKYIDERKKRSSKK